MLQLFTLKISILEIISRLDVYRYNVYLYILDKLGEKHERRLSLIYVIIVLEL